MVLVGVGPTRNAATKDGNQKYGKNCDSRYAWRALPS